MSCMAYIYTSSAHSCMPWMQRAVSHPHMQLVSTVTSPTLSQEQVHFHYHDWIVINIMQHCYYCSAQVLSLAVSSVQILCTIDNT